MKIQAHIDTLKVVGQRTVGDYTLDQYAIEVSIGNDRRVVRCSSPENGHITIYGLAVRFNQGAKIWPGSAVYWFKNGTINNLRPNIDKMGYFLLAGFADDFVGKAVRSKHNAVA